MPGDESRPAGAGDVHELALAMPHVTVDYGTGGNLVYQVGGKSFIFFRNPRPDAADPGTGERYQDVIVFWVAAGEDKQALVQDDASPFSTTAHFDGHLSVLLRHSGRRLAAGSAGGTAWTVSCGPSWAAVVLPWGGWQIRQRGAIAPFRCNAHASSSSSESEQTFMKERVDDALLVIVPQPARWRAALPRPLLPILIT
jgi:hypothetical protein